MIIEVGYYILLSNGDIPHITELRGDFVEAHNDTEEVMFVDKKHIIDSYSSLKELIDKVSAYDYFKEKHPECFI